MRLSFISSSFEWVIEEVNLREHVLIWVVQCHEHLDRQNKPTLKKWLPERSEPCRESAHVGDRGIFKL